MVDLECRPAAGGAGDPAGAILGLGAPANNEDVTCGLQEEGVSCSAAVAGAGGVCPDYEYRVRCECPGGFVHEHGVDWDWDWDLSCPPTPFGVHQGDCAGYSQCLEEGDGK